ncbi:MAG: thiamine biosynthesis lipoprotein [Verrucomicrobiales bacterium]|jgi:thiamine biosynthesis lipoprotein
MDRLARLRNVTLSLLILTGNVVPRLAVAEDEDTQQLQKYTFRQPCMGTLFKLTLYAEDQLTANRAAKAGFDRIIALDAALSDYKEDSELNRLSAKSGKSTTVIVSEDLGKVLGFSQKLSAETKGAFDITIGPLVKLWRQARKTGVMPDDDLLKETRQHVGYSLIRWDNERRTATLTSPSMSLDLGGVAKGFAIDEMYATIRDKFGITRMLIDGGGDVLAGDPPPDRASWNVAVRNPGNEDSPWIVPLANASLATSGDLHQFVEIDGVRYSHIVNPATGMGLTDRLQVSIIARTGMEADALASAVSVLGQSKGLDFIQSRPKCEALIVTSADNTVNIRATDGFPVKTQ